MRQEIPQEIKRQMQQHATSTENDCIAAHIHHSEGLWLLSHREITSDLSNVLLWDLMSAFTGTFCIIGHSRYLIFQSSFNKYVLPEEVGWLRHHLSRNHVKTRFFSIADFRHANPWPTWRCYWRCRPDRGGRDQTWPIHLFRTSLKINAAKRTVLKWLPPHDLKAGLTWELGQVVRWKLLQNILW